MTELLDAFVRGGTLTALEVAFARRLGALAGEARPEVLLAAALACRAPRAGHICVDLSLVASQLTASDLGAALRRSAPEVPEEAEPPEEAAPLPWPEPEAWRAAVAASPLVLTSEETPPLVLRGTSVYLHRFHAYEERLAGRLLARVSGSSGDLAPERVAALLREAMGPPAGEDRQRVAVALALLQRFVVLSGGPGTGKTTTIRTIVALLAALAPPEGELPRVLMLAPTGKAASRLTSALAPPADPSRRLPERLEALLARLEPRGQTLHGALGVKGDNLSTFWRSASNPLGADVVIVDEASMVHFGLMTQLVDAVPPDARLLLVGDKDQLASVEAGAVLGDICAAAAGAGVSPATRERLQAAGAGPLPADGLADWLVHLTVSRRFGATSGIRALSRAINEAPAGPSPASGDAVGALLTPGPGAYADVYRHLPGADGKLPASLDALILAGYAPLLAAVRAGDPVAALDALDAFRILCAHRRGPLSVAALEARTLQLLRQHDGGLLGYDGDFVGRPLLITESSRELGLFNGDTGVILAAPDQESGRAAWFRDLAGGPPRRFSPTRLPPHETVFAMTIHKSQGSQFAKVLVALPATPSPLCTRELLYTAVTRAESEVHVLTTDETLRATVAARVSRFSGLRARLQGAPLGT